MRGWRYALALLNVLWLLTLFLTFLYLLTIQEGIGFHNRNPKRAVSLFLIAAEAGHPGAQCALGLCYDTGKGTSANMQQAVRYYHLAAAQDYAPALVNLGICCYYGEGVVQDRVAAIEYYEQAAELGHATGQFNLGVCYSSGEVEGCGGGARGGAGAGEEVGVRWVRRAAMQGYKPALEYLDKYHISLYH